MCMCKVGGAVCICKVGALCVCVRWGRCVYM